MTVKQRAKRTYQADKLHHHGCLSFGYICLLNMSTLNPDPLETSCQEDLSTSYSTRWGFLILDRMCSKWAIPIKCARNRRAVALRFRWGDTLNTLKPGSFARDYSEEPSWPPSYERMCCVPALQDLLEKNKLRRAQLISKINCKETTKTDCRKNAWASISNFSWVPSNIAETIGIPHWAVHGWHQRNGMGLCPRSHNIIYLHTILGRKSHWIRWRDRVMTNALSKGWVTWRFDNFITI